MSQLKKDMLRGLYWSAIEKYSGLVISIIVSMILARLLKPDEFGVVAIATVIINFLSMFATMGIGPAIIQKKELDENDLNSIYSFSLIIGTILATIFFACSYPISHIYKKEILVPICQILSINVFFASANMVPNALMARDMRFKQMAQRALMLQIISGILSIFAAYYGAGVYALLISPITYSIGIYLYNKQFYSLKLASIKKKSIDAIMSFSIYQFAFDFVNYFSRNLDKLVIGKYIDLTQLGYYEKSYRLMQLPLNNLTGVISPVLQPVMSQLQNDKDEMATKYNKIIKLLSSISFPLGVVLYCYADTIIRIFFGNQWDNAIPTFKILALSVPLQIILSTSGGILQACNAAKAQFWIGIRNTITTVTAFLLAIFYWGSIESVAWAWTISLIINFICSYALIYIKVLKNSFFKMLSTMLYPAICFFVILAMDNLIRFNIISEEGCDYSVINPALFVRCSVSILILGFYTILTGLYKEIKSLKK